MSDVELERVRVLGPTLTLEVRATVLADYVKLLRPQPGDVLVVRGLEIPRDDEGRPIGLERLTETLDETLGFRLPVVAFEDGDADAELERRPA
jgi:hypothetical protein